MSRGLARQGAAFVAVGLAATATHAAVALGLNSGLHVDALAANVVAYICALGVSYVGNAVITFGASVLRGGQFLRFAAVSLAGFGINQTAVFVGVRILGWPLWLSLGPAIVFASATTFALARLWAFQPSAQPANTASAPTLG